MVGRQLMRSERLFNSPHAIISSLSDRFTQLAQECNIDLAESTNAVVIQSELPGTLKNELMAVDAGGHLQIFYNPQQQQGLGQRMADSILYRFTIFFHSICRTALTFHVNGVFGSTDGFLVEHTSSRKQVGSAAGALQVKLLETKFATLPNYNIIHAEGMDKMQSKRARDSAVFQFALQPSARAVYLSLCIHCGGLFASILSQIDLDLDRSIASLGHSSIVVKRAFPSYSSTNNTPFLSYHLPPSYVEYFRNEVWSTLLTEVVKCAESHVFNKFSKVTASTAQDFVPSTTARKGIKLPQKDKALDDTDVIDMLFDISTTTSNSTVNFWYSVSSLLLEMLLMKGVTPITELQPNALDERHIEGISQFLYHIQQMLLKSVPHTSYQLSAHITSNSVENPWIRAVIEKLKVKPIAHIPVELYNKVMDTTCLSSAHPHPHPHQQPEGQGQSLPCPPSISSPPSTAVVPQRAIVTNIISFDIPGSSGPQPPDAEDFETIEDSIKKALNPGEGSDASPQNAYLLAKQPDTSTLDETGCCTTCKFDWKSLKEGAYIFAIPQHERIPQSVVNFITKYAIKPVNSGQVDEQIQSIEPSVMSPSSKKRAATQMMLSDRATTTTYDTKYDYIQGPEDLPDYDDLAAERERELIEQEDILQPMIQPVSTNSQQPSVLNHNNNNNNKTTTIEVASSKLTIAATKTNNDESDNDPIFVVETRPTRTVREEVDYSTSVLLCKRKCDNTFDVNDLLTLWAREREFSESRADTPLWTSENIRVNYGPLSTTTTTTTIPSNQPMQQLNKQGVQQVYRYQDNLELMATMQAVICRDIHNELSEIFWDRATWEDLDYAHNRLYEIRRDTSIEHVRFMQVCLTPSTSGGYITDFQQYDVVTVATYIEPQHVEQRQRYQRRRKQPLEFEYLFGMVTNYKLKKDDEEALVNVTILGGQRIKSRPQSSTSPSASSSPAAYNPTLAVVRRCGFIGTEIRQSLAFRGLFAFSRQWFHILLNNEYNRSEVFGRINPFSNDSSQPSRAVISKYVSDARINPGCSKWLEFLATDTSVQQHPFLNASQTAAICEILQVEQDCHRGLDQRRHKIPFLCLVGPAGTGKTYTIFRLINTLYHHSDVGYSIYNMQTYVALAHNKQQSTRHNDSDTSFIDATFIPPEEFLSILIVTETHAALDVIEERLLDGFEMFFEEESPSNDQGAQPSSSSTPTSSAVKPKYKCLPTYTRVGTQNAASDSNSGSSDTRPRRTTREMELDRKRARMPRVIRRRFRGCIVLSTFGSLRRAFEGKCFLKGRQQNRLPQYDLVIIDEASMVGKKNLGQLAHHLSLSKTSNASEIPIVIAGDPLQVPPHSSGKRDIFTDLSSLSVMHEMIPSATAITSGQDLCHYVQLDTQYRMHAVISHLSNIVAERKVFNGPGHKEMKGFQYTQAAPAYRPMDLCALPRFDFPRFAYPVLWLDPYASRTWGSVDWLTGYTNTVNVSTSEVYNCVALAKDLIDGNHFRANQIAVFTPYHGQRSAIVHALKYVDKDHRPPRYGDVKVQTVKSAQGAEMPCVIISPVRNGSTDYRGANRTGIAGDIHTIYVAITRATHALFIVGHAGFLQSNAQWRHIIDYCQGKYSIDEKDN